MQELVENLFAKKFEPRSRAKRKETRNCPKNMTHVVRAGAGWSSGKFVNFVADGLENAERRVSEMNRQPTAKRSFVDRMKSMHTDGSAGAGGLTTGEQATRTASKVAFESSTGENGPSANNTASAMSRRSQLAHLQERKQLAALQVPSKVTGTDAHSSGTDSSEDDYFTRDDSESESTSSPTSPHSPHTKVRYLFIAFATAEIPLKYFQTFKLFSNRKANTRSSICSQTTRATSRPKSLGKPKSTSLWRITSRR